MTEFLRENVPFIQREISEIDQKDGRDDCGRKYWEQSFFAKV